MRYAILADIHANLDALTAVLGDVEQQGGVDEIWCLGDIVGYGPEPSQCIEVLKRCEHVCVAGNHDLAAIGKLDASFFNPLAAAAIAWTAKQLSAADNHYLEHLPLTLEKGDFLLVHGGPAEPALEYIMSTSIANRNLAFFKSRYCLVGHTHAPALFREQEGSCVPVSFSPAIGLVLGSSRMIINPGAVGQPRDGDPRAAYALYDTEGRIMRLHRVEYDITAVQRKMMKAGLPVGLSSRLEAGQ